MTRLLAAASAAAVLTLTATGCGATSRSSSAPRSPNPAQARQLLAARLRAKGLDFRWIACIPNGRSFRGAGIVRCNVDFGDPHVEAYCSVLEHGRLVTDHEDPAIPCRRDEAGWSAPISGS